MGKPSATRTYKPRKRRTAVAVAAVGSLFLCCALSLVPLSFLLGTGYLQAGPPGWRPVELPIERLICLPDEWTYSVDADSKNVVIADESGTILFYGFIADGTYYEVVIAGVHRRLVGYEFVRETQRMTDEVSTWHELRYRDVETGELVTVQVINTRGSDGIFSLYSVPDAVDRNTARKMAFS
jgi:hypothetical protein